MNLLDSFRQYVRLFSSLETCETLFPKTCRTCGRVFQGMSHFLLCTMPKGHGMEDCADVMSKPYTMVYRHCGCGNTLVLTLTAEHTLVLEDFWRDMKRLSESTEDPMREVLEKFVAEWELWAVDLQVHGAKE